MIRRNSSNNRSELTVGAGDDFFSLSFRFACSSSGALDVAFIECSDGIQGCLDLFPQLGIKHAGLAIHFEGFKQDFPSIFWDDYDFNSCFHIFSVAGFPGEVRQSASLSC